MTLLVIIYIPHKFGGGTFKSNLNSTEYIISLIICQFKINFNVKIPTIFLRSSKWTKYDIFYRFISCNNMQLLNVSQQYMKIHILEFIFIIHYWT